MVESVVVNDGKMSRNDTQESSRDQWRLSIGKVEEDGLGNNLGEIGEPSSQRAPVAGEPVRKISVTVCFVLLPVHDVDVQCFKIVICCSSAACTSCDPQCTG